MCGGRCGCECVRLREENAALAREVERIRAECDTLKVGWREFERVGLAQEELIARLRAGGGTNALANDDRRG